MSDPIPTITSAQTPPEATRQRENRMSKEETELNKAKRKSNAYLAAEAVQQERDALKTLKRLSMGGSLTLDPDLPYGVDNEFEDYQKKRQHKRRSSSGSISSTSSEDGDKTLINDDQQELASPQEPQDGDEDEDIKMDAEKLLWVPAKAHPSIAPDQFRRHVQSTLDDMTKKLHREGSQRSDKSTDSNGSIPSLKELTDELDKLSEMAGLAATDAVTLARSLSSASSSTSLLYGDTPSSDIGTSSENESSSPSRLSEDEIDQDAPLLAENSLKRNKWTTYTRRSRTDKLDKTKRRHSPLSDDNFRAMQESNLARQRQEKPLPQQPQEQYRQQQQQHPQQHSYPQRSVSQQQPQRDSRHRPLNRSQSDIGANGNASKKTNHSRNRHAGSLITIEQEGQQQQHPPVQQEIVQQTAPLQKRVTSPLSSEFESVQRSQTPPLPRPETQATRDPPEPPTPVQQPVQRERIKESKSKEFLNIFKMKRSPSPKNVKDKRRVTPTRSTFNDENVNPSTTSPQQSEPYPNQQHHHQVSPQGQQGDSPPTEQQKVPPQRRSPQRPSLKPSSFKLTKKEEQKSPTSSPTEKHFVESQQRGLQESVSVVPKRAVRNQTPTSSTKTTAAASSPQTSPKGTANGGLATTEEQHRQQRELLLKKLTEQDLNKPTKPNAPVQFTDSAFGFPLPPLSRSTIIMLDYRFPIHVERALYRLSHLKLANPKRQLRQQVLLSNFMYAYLNLVNHTLYLEQMGQDQEQEDE